MMKPKPSLFAAVALLLAGFLSHADAKWPSLQFVKTLGGAASSGASFEVPAAGTLEVAFSPSEGAEELVLKVIKSAHTSLHLMAYSFTSPRVTAALIQAKRNGVVVTVVADLKGNTTDDRSGKSRAALSAMHLAGIDVRLIGAYAISHDKVIISDLSHTQTGSFNYTDAAARRNSENVLVHWSNPALASVYMKHFERNYRQSKPFQPAY